MPLLNQHVLARHASLQGLIHWLAALIHTHRPSPAPCLMQMHRQCLHCLFVYSQISTRMLSPRRTRFRKQHRGRLKGISTRGNSVCFGRFGLQALEPSWVTSRQIEAARRAITRYARRGGKLWIRVFPDKSITMRAAETRMGSGKGSPEYWVAVVKPGRMLYEMSGVSESIARAAMRIASFKMPMRTHFVMARTLKQREPV